MLRQQLHSSCFALKNRERLTAAAAAEAIASTSEHCYSFFWPTHKQMNFFFLEI
jgi:hypothetical protein